MECKVVYVEDLEVEYYLKIYRLESDTNEFINNANKTKRRVERYKRV